MNYELFRTFAPRLRIIAVERDILLFTRTKIELYKNNKNETKMKKGIHPENYRPVVFKDMSNGDMFLSQSCAKSNETIEFEGKEYPLIKLEISSSSHPFYTGKAKLVDTAGRVDKFMSRYKVMSKK